MKRIEIDPNIKMIILKDETRILIHRDTKVLVRFNHIEIGSLKINKNDIKEVY